MTAMTLDTFVQENRANNPQDALFDLESHYTLEVNLKNQMAWIKLGSMVAYKGNLQFAREGFLEHGLGNLLKKAVTGEGSPMMKATGTGKLYVADSGKRAMVLMLGHETLTVNANDVLAYQENVQADIRLLKVAGMVAGGISNLTLTGPGAVVITTHYQPLVLEVTPDQPVFTDPNATVAWSGSLNPDIHVEASLRTLIGRGSGESVQLKFQGKGFVVVQPYEEVGYANSSSY
jgi:uncharacterized protein (AIM24 family)